MADGIPQMKLVETATLKKFVGDQSDPDNCVEVIVTKDGVPVEHWRKLLVAEGDKLINHWTRTEIASRDEALRIGDSIHRSDNA